MQAADLWDRNDASFSKRGDWARNGRVLVERQVSAGLFVIRTIERHQSMQARFVENDDVIKTLATRGSNESLDKCILPRCTRCCEHLLHPDCLRGGPYAVERAIAIVE
jgi:hypothetical protein